MATYKNPHPLQILLKGYGLTGRSLATVLGCSPTTGVAKLKDVDRLTVADLRRISAKWGIPIEAIRDAL